MDSPDCLPILLSISVFIFRSPFSHLLVAGSVRYVSYWVHVKITSSIISYRVARWRHASVEVHLSEQANDVLNRARLGDSAKGMHFRHVNGSVVGWGFRSAWGHFSIFTPRYVRAQYDSTRLRTHVIFCIAFLRLEANRQSYSLYHRPNATSIAFLKTK